MQSVRLGARALILTSSLAILKRADQQTAAHRCQQSVLIGPWWTEWKMCLILFFVLVPALIDLQQLWNQYRIALFHYIGSQHTLCLDKDGFPQSHTTASLSGPSARVGFIGDLKPMLCFYPVCWHVRMKCLNALCCVRVGLKNLWQQVWYPGRE